MEIEADTFSKKRKGKEKEKEMNDFRQQEVRRMGEVRWHWNAAVPRKSEIFVNVGYAIPALSEANAANEHV